MIVTAPGAQAAPSPGQGSSYAQSLTVAPHDGSLAVGVTLGEALAGHTNGIARAQSQGVDLGAIGTSLTGYNCGSQSFKPDQVPQPLETETGQPGADKGISQQPDPSTGTSQPSFGSNEFVKATATPYGEADTSFAPLTTAAFTVSNMATRAWSGLVNGQREAGATSDIGALSIANGLVKMTGLHWESVYPSGGAAEPSGSFTLGSLQIAGTPVPTDQSPAALQDAVNQVLATVGLKVLFPQSSVERGVQSVSALQIEAVPNNTRDNAINAGLNATEGAQQQVFGGLENGFSPAEPSQLVQALCQSDTPITVAQIAIASVNGGGFLSAGLGGVNSSSSAVAANPYNLSLLGSITLGGNSPAGDLSSATGSGGATGAALTAAPSPSVGGMSGSALSPSTGALPGSSGGAGSGGSAPVSGRAGSPQVAPVTNAAAVHYGAGGPLLGIGLAGLGLLGLLAEVDRRMMRRAQYTVNFEE